MREEASKILEAQKGRPLRIYAWSTDEIPRYAGCLKVGQTTQDLSVRINQSKGQARYRHRVEVVESAERDDGSLCSDYELRRHLVEKGFENTELEWMRCTPEDVLTAISELKTGVRYEGTHSNDFEMRAEQAEAVQRTAAYYRSLWAEDPEAVPRFLWNAKMRFGKTFAAYQLAKEISAQRTLVVTFKPAVEVAWQDDLESHVDFDGWQYRSANHRNDPTDIDPDRPLVYFGSFQDLLGRDPATGTIKARNEWIHTINWDLVIFDEYHFGAWRDRAKGLFETGNKTEDKRALAVELAGDLEEELASQQDSVEEETAEFGENIDEFLPITTDAYLYLSGTPFKALATGEFIEEQIFNWTYTDEQAAKAAFARDHPGEPNPYEALPEMRLLTYQMPDELIAIASQGEFDEFDLTSFFEAEGSGDEARFVHADDVQKWLDIIRGKHLPTQVSAMKAGTRPPFPYSDSRLLPYMQHSFWFLPSVASCEAMANLLRKRHNVYWHDYEVLVVAGPQAGIGLDALPPVRDAIRSGYETKTIVLSCGKLTTGVTVPQWSSILMLRNLTSPETYFQAAFRVQSPWVLLNPHGDDPSEIEVVKPVCYVFDFAPTRALKQISEYGVGLAPEEPNPEDAVEKLVNFLPVLAYDGSNMTQVDAGTVLDIAMSGTSASLLARRWKSPILVNVDNQTLRRIMDNEAAMQAVMNIEGFRALGSDIFEAVVNQSEKVRQTKREKGASLSEGEKEKLSEEEKELRSKRKLIQEKLVKFATRIPVFMYLTDFRENKLQDVISEIEPDLFRTVTGLTVADFDLLVSLGVFHSGHMNDAIFSFRRYEDASLSYTGIESHEGLRLRGLYDTVVAIED